ncbi:Ribosomal protein L31e [uncultured archaeon]|nr:Ribosomal protein L31e [uncultured archaeon]
MAKEKKSEPKLILEREYIVPLRREWLKVGMHKRANRAVKELKKFIAKHMKLYDRDLRQVKIDQILNNEIRFRGMKKPPAKIKVLAKKYDNNIVKVELVDIPNHVKFARLREEKIKKETPKAEVKEEKKVEKQETDESKQKEAKDKEEASKEETMKISKEQAREQKHIAKPQNSVEKSFETRKSQKGR